MLGQAFVTAGGAPDLTIAATPPCTPTPPTPGPGIGLTETSISGGAGIAIGERQGPPGPPGPPGASALLAQNVAGQAIVAPGLPIYIARGSNLALLADARDPLRSHVIGVSADASAAGFVLDIVRGRIVSTDWTSIAGSEELTPGIPYFLNVGGGITAGPPDRGRGFATSVIIGLASDPMTLVVLPQPRILL